MNAEVIISIVAAVALAAFLIILYVRHIVNENTITAIAGLLDTLVDKTSVSETFFERLVRYCDTAVKAVEQMVKSGQIPKEDKARVETATKFVEDYMQVNGEEVTDEAKTAVRSIIESEVHWIS